MIFDLLDNFDRIFYIDSDCFIKENCPNIFDEVPEGQLGLFNEESLIPRPIKIIKNTFKFYNIDPKTWKGKYYNTGVMVISKNHKPLFLKPELEEPSPLPDGNYINVMISKLGIDVYKLPLVFNYMPIFVRYNPMMMSSEPFIVHFADMDKSRIIKIIKSK